MEGIARRRALAREKFEKLSAGDAAKESPAKEDIKNNNNHIFTSKATNAPAKDEGEQIGERRERAAKAEQPQTALGQGRPKNLDALMVEKKREREKQQRLKAQEQQKNRNIFKQQLEKNAPKPDPSQECALKRGHSNIDRLLRWVQKRVNDYPGVNVTDFSSSWSDGLAFCAVMHVLVPDKISMDGLNAADRRKNFELAFKVASDEGVPELLDVEDMVRVPVPDKRSVVTYVHTIYKVLVQDKQQKKKDEEN